MAKKKPSFVRTTISLSAALKSRMDAIKDQVNWSAIAARAFECKLAEFAAAKETKEMSDVIARLRQSRLESMDVNFREGKRRGDFWAREHAEFSELKSLEDLWRFLEREPEHRWTAYFSEDTGTPNEVAERLDKAVRPPFGGMWEDNGIHEEQDHLLFSSYEFIRGFAEGALEFWWSVNEDVER